MREHESRADVRGEYIAAPWKEAGRMA